MLSYDELRKKYSSPKASYVPKLKRYRMSDYCVGAALYREYKLDTHPGKRIRSFMSTCFPPRTYVALGLMHRNDMLTESSAQVYASCIINLNDGGHFEFAWEIVKEISEDITLSLDLENRLKARFGELYLSYLTSEYCSQTGVSYNYKSFTDSEKFFTKLEKVGK